MSLAVVITIAVGARVLWHLMSPSEYTSGYRTRYTITKAITSYTLPLSEVQRLCQKDLAILSKDNGMASPSGWLAERIAAETGHRKSHK